MVFEHQDEYPPQGKAIEAIAEKLDVHRETLRQWVRRVEIDGGSRPGVTTDERDRIRELEAEIRRVYDANLFVYGSDKIWDHLNAVEGTRSQSVR